MLFSKEIKGNYTIYSLLGIKLKFRNVANNKIFIVDKQGNKKQVKRIKGLNIDFGGSNSTIILHSPTLKFTDSKIILKSNSLVEIGTSQYSANKLVIRSYGNNQTTKIGDDFSCTMGCSFLFSKEENLCVEVGNNCMCASNVVIRPSDGHTIYDKDTGNVLNYGKNILIKDNVWLAMYSTILKGVTIEEGCVIGTGSLVTKSCNDPHSIYAGVPAKKIKSNISWDRDAIPDYLEKHNF